jgi:hypothetical protein
MTGDEKHPLIQPSSPANAEEIVERFIEVQFKEVNVREQELELKRQQDSNQYSYALASLDAQRTDRKEMREHQQGLFKVLVLAVVLVVGIIAGIIITAILTGNAALAGEIFKAIAYVLTGVFGRYGLGRVRSKKRNDSIE